MKRLNPETGKPFVRGDTRADGFLFGFYKSYKKLNGFLAEQWYAPQVYKDRSLRQAARQTANPEKHNQKAARYRKANPAKINARCAKRRSAKLQRTLSWLTKEHYAQIESFYIEAKRITENTGILHVVDHIVPLQGDIVSGLHVPWNLQILSATDNSRKSNRLL